MFLRFEKQGFMGRVSITYLLVGKVWMGEICSTFMKKSCLVFSMAISSVELSQLIWFDYQCFLSVKQDTFSWFF